jgi:transketolase
LSLEPLTDKWTAFGWDAVTIDGHSIGELIHVLDRTRTHRLSKPLVVIAETVKGRGINFIENDPAWHPKAVTGGDYERAKKVLA